MNVGNAMNLSTGVFTVPVNATYSFTFSGLRLVNNRTVATDVLFRHNGISIGGTRENRVGGLSAHATLPMKAGDTFDTFLMFGAIYDNDGEGWTQFSGLILDEDLQVDWVHQYFSFMETYWITISLYYLECQ